MTLKEQRVIEWLLGKEQPSVRYLTLRDLLGLPEDDPDVRDAFSGIRALFHLRLVLAARAHLQMRLTATD